jgi:deoxyribodipyrimidine photo-lyase
MKPAASIVWFRQDLRLADNPALVAAIKRGQPVVPLFIWSPEEEGEWQPGGASRWWLHQSLLSLDKSLRGLGSRLIVRQGGTMKVLRAVIKETGADAVFWNRRYEPVIIARDKQIKESLKSDGGAAESFNAALLHEPWTVQNKTGNPFQVFTPYWKHCLAKPDPAEPLASPKGIPSSTEFPQSVEITELELEPRIKWAETIRSTWQPGEVGARAALNRFLAGAFETYSERRNRPDISGTSRLSPFFHFGEISPRQVWHSIRREAEKSDWPLSKWRSSQFIAEIGWREFAHHLLFHFPHTATEPLKPQFNNFPWRRDADFLKRWQRGQTGYPIVDAGMRELWATGWMHNRVRMIVASFLVKDLLQPWQDGARWFWDTLVDADLAQNTSGWQWTAGCGADAAPYFRVFNPISQAEKFDPQGHYVRRWCPELGKLPDEWIHQPHEAPTNILAAAGVVLGKNYPHPIVSHAIAREVALEAYEKIKRASEA